eukprot:9850926-Ditylum_brightwellii.AAC.1
MVANILRATINGTANAMQQAALAVDDALATAMHATRDRHQEIINKNLRCQSLKQHEWHYTVGQEVMIKEINPNKLQPRAHG